MGGLGIASPCKNAEGYPQPGLNNTQHPHPVHCKPDATTSAVRCLSGGPVTIAGTAGHDKPETPVTMPESAVTIIRNDRSRSAGIRTLTCIHPAHAGLPTNSSPLRVQRDLGSMSEHCTGTAKCPEPLCCRPVLPPCRRHPASPRRTLLPLHRSYGLMRQTCCPPSGFGSGLAQKVFAGCCQPLLGTGPSRRYLCQSFPTCLDLYSGCSQGARARYFPQDIGLPREWSGSARRGSPTATSVGTTFRSCSHLLMFRPTGLLATPVAPTSRLSTLSSRGFYIRAYQSSLPHSAADMLSVQNRAIDGRRTFTSQDWQPCRLLPTQL